MSRFVKKSIKPPDCEEGDILKAQIIDIKKETSKWKDNEGNLREQLVFDLELENGYKARTWATYYDEPKEASLLGKLALTLERMSKIQSNDMSEFLKALKLYGQVFIRVKGFRTYEGELFPNFALVGDKLPGSQAKLQTPTQTQGA